VLDWYQEHLVDTNRSAMLWALLGFVVTYAVVRWVTLSIRNRPKDSGDEGGAVKDVYIGGVHIHHQVWGILLVMVTGLLEFRFHPSSPWAEVLAALFGVGAALALDEFALWLHVDDVYWSPEGRKSIDAVLVALVVGGALLLGSAPFGVSSKDAQAGLLVVSGIVVVHIGVIVVCLLKGKLPTGLIGLVVPLIGLVGAVRLAKPESYWARRRYGAARLARSRDRFDEDYDARREHVRTLMSGQFGRHAPVAAEAASQDESGNDDTPGTRDAGGGL
jgi:hypothetical protein